MNTKIHIAIVDDKAINRDQIKTSLEWLDARLFEFDGFKSFFTFYSQKEQSLPNVLILDYFLEQWKTWEKLLDELYSTFSGSREITVIGFSSLVKCSQRIAEVSGWIFLHKKVGEPINNELRSQVERIILWQLDT